MVLNFGALAIGSYFMNNGPSSNWYLTLNKAPWTPPGWVFGAAWFSIMICYSIYMANLIMKCKNTYFVWFLFAIQFILNVSWNYFFFNLHQTVIGLLIITNLTLLIAYFLVGFRSILQQLSLWTAPYFIWLILATSLNLYIIANN
ncbi:TspO/MBR family protein [Lutibacter holmesii]|uniref:TspO/MBR family protein n=1 Tax=Lutibacter holmesii TaxID=1137985 RepID=A0ABW3WQS9_9FLAO